MYIAVNMAMQLMSAADNFNCIKVKSLPPSNLMEAQPIEPRYN